MDYVSRAQWGARPWASQTYTAPWWKRTETLVHYHGNPPRYSRGAEVARDVDAIHHGNGWAGVGYNWLVDQDGVIYEGRGWDLVGAHCPGHNTSGIGIYVAIGGDQKPTDVALAGVRRVYDEGSRLAGRPLRKTWHGENYPTACPGLPLIGWVRGGMVVAAARPATHRKVILHRVLRSQDPMLTGDDVRAVQRKVGTLADSWFGPLTATGVRRWQRTHGLTPDGVVGPVTARAMGYGWSG